MSDLTIFSRKCGLGLPYLFSFLNVQGSNKFLFRKKKYSALSLYHLYTYKIPGIFFYSVKQDIPKFWLLPSSYPCWFIGTWKTHLALVYQCCKMITITVKLPRIFIIQKRTRLVQQVNWIMFLSNLFWVILRYAMIFYDLTSIEFLSFSCFIVNSYQHRNYIERIPLCQVRQMILSNEFYKV